jgi:hypothetical protein
MPRVVQAEGRRSEPPVPAARLRRQPDVVHVGHQLAVPEAEVRSLPLGRHRSGVGHRLDATGRKVGEVRREVGLPEERGREARLREPRRHRVGRRLLREVDPVAHHAVRARVLSGQDGRPRRLAERILRAAAGEARAAAARRSSAGVAPRDRRTRRSSSPSAGRWSPRHVHRGPRGLHTQGGARARSRRRRSDCRDGAGEIGRFAVSRRSSPLLERVAQQLRRSDAPPPRRSDVIRRRSAVTRPGTRVAARPAPCPRPRRAARRA